MTTQKFDGHPIPAQSSLQQLKREAARLEALSDCNKRETEEIRILLNSLHLVTNWMESDEFQKL